MSNYQLRFCDRSGCGSFLYIEAETLEEAKEKAVEKANEFLEHERTKPIYFPSRRPKPIPTVKVVEIYKKELRPERVYLPDGGYLPTHEWITKRGGNKFALTLSYIEATMSDGSKRRAEWYIVKED